MCIQNIHSYGVKPLCSSFTLLQEADVYNKLWYASACDRKTADDVLHQTNKVRTLLRRATLYTCLSGQFAAYIKPCWVWSFYVQDGAFLVRKSSGHDTQQPYTLVVFYNGKVYNIPIRYLQTTQQYALGREKKGEEVKEMTFHSVVVYTC